MNQGTDWGEQARRLVGSLGGALAGLTAHVPAGDAGDAEQRVPECRWCPLCQFLAVVRGERPEAAAALADILTATANALHAFAAAADGASSAGQRSGATETPAAPPTDDEGEPPPVVQRIEIA
jgi:hypothetical protein